MTMMHICSHCQPTLFSPQNGNPTPLNYNEWLGRFEMMDLLGLFHEISEIMATILKVLHHITRFTLSQKKQSTQ